MAKKKSLEDRAYEKVQREFDEYIADIKTKSPEEIVEAAYEITYKQEILCMFECEGAFNDKQSVAILKTKNALDYLYNEWLDYDGSVCDTLRDCVDLAIENQIDYFKKQEERDSR